MKTPRRLGAVVLAIAAVAACGDDDEAGPAASEPPVHAERCVVHLHGRSETGRQAELRDGYAVLSPEGNGEYEDGRQWLYASEDDYSAAADVVERAIVDSQCAQVVLNGFSNGGAFAAKLYCRGETFGDVVAGVVIDDPVPDEGTQGCAPAPGVDVALYWTGALTEATPGTSCDELGWTCEGELLVGIDAYADALGAPIQESAHDDHTWYDDAPELTAWLGL